MATSKYPFTGPNYAQYGEVQGYVYYPWTEEYYVDVNAVQEYNYATGQQERPKKDPSYWEQIAPVAGAALIYSGAQEAGKQIPGMLSGSGTTGATTTVSGSGAGATSATTGTTAGAQTANTGTNLTAATAPTTVSTSATPVATTTLADGSAGVVLSDGSVVSANATSSTGAWAGTALSWLGVAGMAYLYGSNIYENSGKEMMKGNTSTQGGVDLALDSNLVTGWINPVTKAMGLGTVGSMIGSGKGTDQRRRDAWRKWGEKVELLEKRENAKGKNSHHVQLVDGSYFDVGLDEGNKTEDGLRIHDVNFDNPMAGEVVGMINPLAAISVGGTKGKTKGLQEHSTGYLTNAALSSGDINQARANALSFYQKVGLDKQGAIESLNELLEKEKITPEEHKAFIGGVNTVFAGDTTRPQGMITEGGQPQAPQPTPQAQPQGMIPVQPQAGQQPQMAQTAQEADPNRLTPRSASNNPYTTNYQPQQQQPMGMIPSGVEQRYGSGVAQQVAANPNVGVGGPGYRWDGKQFVRG